MIRPIARTHRAATRKAIRIRQLAAEIRQKQRSSLRENLLFSAIMITVLVATVLTCFLGGYLLTRLT